MQHAFGSDASTGVLVWWAALTCTGVFGVGLWISTARRFARRRGILPPALFAARRTQLWLSGVYAFGCAFRSIFPRADVQRICLFDGWISNVMVGRSVATLAELCFVLQWALMLREASADGTAKFAAIVSHTLVPVIVVAEICSWYAVITTNFLGNAIEQSLWNVSVALMTLSLVLLLPRYTDTLRKLILAWVVFGVAFVLFVTFVDVPMYVTRWQADEAQGVHYFSLADGLHDLATRWVVTYAWLPWRDEIAWMSLYFSAAVWISISFTHVPWLGKSPEVSAARTA